MRPIPLLRYVPLQLAHRTRAQAAANQTSGKSVVRRDQGMRDLREAVHWQKLPTALLSA